jgi:hypothetical protein
MREQEMRECVGHFLKARMRAMLLPATLGLGLAVAGCDKEALESTDDSGTSSQIEAGVTHPDTQIEAGATHPDTQIAPPIVTKYIAQLPDANVAPAYMAQLPDAGTVTKYIAQLPDAALVTKYIAQLPDANIAPEYMAQMPDARVKDAMSPDSGMMVRYMAPLPNPGQPVLLYMAQYPDT